MRLLRALFVLLALAAIALVVALLVTRPEPLPEDTESARRLARGAFEVGRVEFEWTDDSRPTAANGEFEGLPHRRFPVSLWYPEAAPGPHPLVVYSHGFMSNRHGGTHLARHLARNGTVVVSTDYPLTNYFAPGGPTASDIVHQPGDVRFLIDRVLALEGGPKPFEGEIDARRIGVMGISLGGLTSTLVAYHPEYRDPRVGVAISIAGPGVLFSRDYFGQAPVPFLMIAGTHDSMIHYEENAAPIPDRIRAGGLVTIEAGSHAGFSYLAAGPMRLLGNPDRLGCDQLTQNLELADEDPFATLGGAEHGLIDASDALRPCEETYEQATPAARQHWVSRLAAQAFLESVWAPDEPTRSDAKHFLAETLPSELPDVRFEAARGAPLTAYGARMPEAAVLPVPKTRRNSAVERAAGS